MLLNKSKYSDLPVFLTKNRYTNDFNLVNDNNSIRQAIKNIILTKKTERPFNRDFGSNIQDTLFSSSTNGLLNNFLESDIYSAIVKNEPRVDGQSMIMNVVNINNTIKIDIKFNLVNSDEIVTIVITL